MICRETFSIVYILFFFLNAVACEFGYLPIASANATAVVQSEVVQTDEVSDNDILEAVELEFRSDDSLTPDTIDVIVAEGIVTLGGETQTLLAKRQAVRAVGSLKGVRGIANQIRVAASSLSDDELIAEVKTALQDRADMKLKDVSATIGANGDVRLSGTSNSFMGRRLTEDLVANIRGVTSIENKIRVAT